MDASAFLSALLAIVIIDLVLAGDNAIVIALAARNLPAALRKKAILWGTFGAIAVRTAMTVIVVWLLKIPGLLLIGGALLVWMAWKLLMPDEAEAESAHPAATGFWAAMRTIIVADALMGLDNVLAVAGAAHGSYLLVVLGLLISIPIVVWGSQLVLKIVDRYPAVVYLGAGVLVLTAAKMMLAENLVKPWVQAQPLWTAAAYALIPLVLFGAFVRNHLHLESRIHARLSAFDGRRPAGRHSQPPEGEKSMLNVLVPYDGSRNSLLALRHAIGEYRANHDLRLHLLNVQAPLTRHVARFLSGADRGAWHRQQAEAALKSGRRELERAGVPYETHTTLGERAHEIVQAARRLAAHHIVMGTARKHTLARMFQSSTTAQVLEHTPVPVEVVAGDEVPALERWGLRAGVLASAGGLMMLVLD